MISHPYHHELVPFLIHGLVMKKIQWMYQVYLHPGDICCAIELSFFCFFRSVGANV